MEAGVVFEGKVRLRKIDKPHDDPPPTGFKIVGDMGGKLYLKIGDAMHLIDMDVAQVIACLTLDDVQEELRQSREIMTADLYGTITATPNVAHPKIRMDCTYQIGNDFIVGAYIDVKYDMKVYEMLDRSGHEDQLLEVLLKYQELIDGAAQDARSGP